MFVENNTPVSITGVQANTTTDDERKIIKTTHELHFEMFSALVNINSSRIDLNNLFAFFVLE